MSQSQDPELVARQITKALDGIATIARIADILVETNTRNTRELANLTALVTAISETVDYLEKIVIRDGDASLVMKVSKLKDAVDSMKAHAEELTRARDNVAVADRTGAWNQKTAIIVAIATILTAIITSVIAHFWK